MKTYVFYVEQKIIRNLSEIKNCINEAVKNVGDPTQYVFEVNYSKVDSQITTSSSIAFQNILKAGFQKVIVTNLKPAHKKEAYDNAVIKLLMKREQLEIR